MKIAAVYSVYNEEEYIEYSIRSIYEFVDRIFVLLGAAPWKAYNPKAREEFQKADNTEKIIRELIVTHPKITLIKDIWESQIDQRNTGMKLCHKGGFNYYFLVDGDEVYTKDHLEVIRQELISNPKASQFIIKCHVFWRSFLYRFPANEMSWMPRRIFRVTKISRLGKSWIPLPVPCRFTGVNRTDGWGGVRYIPQEKAVFYHFAYSRKPEKLWQKIRTFAASPDIMEGWYENVWLKWPKQKDMTMLHPTEPKAYKRAVFHDLSDLPEVMKKHPYYNLEIIE